MGSMFGWGGGDTTFLILMGGLGGGRGGGANREGGGMIHQCGEHGPVRQDGHPGKLRIGPNTQSLAPFPQDISSASQMLFSYY